VSVISKEKEKGEKEGGGGGGGVGQEEKQEQEHSGNGGWTTTEVPIIAASSIHCSSSSSSTFQSTFGVENFIAAILSNTSSMGVCNSAEKRERDFNVGDLEEKGPKVEGIHTKKSRAHDAAGKQSQDRCGATLKRLQGTDGLFEALDTGNTGHLNSKDILFFLKACRGQKVVTHNDGGSDEEKDFKKAFDIVSKADMDNDGLLDRKEFTQWILGSKYDDENLLKSLNKTVIELKRREPDESLEKVWLRYKDEEGGDKIEEKLSDLLNAIDLDPEGVQSFAFAWKLRHGTMGPISRSEFIAPLKQQGVETWDGLLSWAKKLRIEIKNNTKYKEMYTWLFDYVKEEGIRTIGKDVAEYVWSLALVILY